MAVTARIPLFYRILFTWVDPLGCALGFAAHLFDPVTTIEGYSPSFQNPPRVETIHLMDTLAGFFALLVVLEAVLLRLRPHDAAVWRCVHTGGAIMDFIMAWGAVRALRTEGRLAPVSGWRGDDWKLVVANGVTGLLRAACALGIGFGPPELAKATKTA